LIKFTDWDRKAIEAEMRQRQELEVSCSASFAHNSISKFETFKNMEKSFIEADFKIIYNDIDNFKKIEEKDEETLESNIDDDYIAIDFLTI
jgi:hypothetical protein